MSCQCYDFELDDNTAVSYLIADVSVECDTDEHQLILIIATIGIFAYPIGIMVFNAYSLYQSASTIKVSIRGHATPNTLRARAIRFLYQDYKVRCHTLLDPSIGAP